MNWQPATFSRSTDPEGSPRNSRFQRSAARNYSAGGARSFASTPQGEPLRLYDAMRNPSQELANPCTPI